MKLKLLIVYIILIALPLVVLGWLGVRAIGHEREMVDRNVEILLTEQLRVYDTRVQRLMQDWALEWESGDWDANDIDAIRDRIARDGRVTQFFILDNDAVLVYPSEIDEQSNREREFLLRTESVWMSGAIHPNQLIDSDGFPAEGRASSFAKKSDGRLERTMGRWYEWYWGDGLQLMYWWPSESGGVYGVEVDRVRLLADIIGALPDTPDTRRGESLGVELLNESGHLLYQWGQTTAEESTLASAQIPLTAPLGSWSMAASMAVFPDSMAGNGLLLGTGLAGLALVLGGLAVYFYRESTRELREASQRVSFVNHVSHELKTPLTNIRMYAELMQHDMDSEASGQSGRLAVILSESQRLSRLITNVLTFNRNRGNAIALHPKPTDLDDHVRQVVSHFADSFAERGIDVQFEGGIKGEVLIDGDVVEQIVGNLLSNVEKYAPKSCEVCVTTHRDGMNVFIGVQDSGPGIDASEQEAIFEPFYRVRNDLTEGVSGTGIGLSISRDLARLHGGDLELVPCDTGAHFRVRLAVQGDAR